jgi:hypothetical protein
MYSFHEPAPPALLQNGGSAMAASRNGFGSYKLSIHKKTNVMQIMTKILQFLFI